MSTLDNLIAQFEKFPGVGARQARRFAFHILTMGKEDVNKLATNIQTLQGSMAECTNCHRFFITHGGSERTCAICSDSNRDSSKLLVVASDSDITSIERSGVYDGLYFVLGGTVPLLNTEDINRLRGGALKHRLNDEVTEVILGFAINPDGENTGRYVEKLITETDFEPTISLLGRGLSTGSELEYADPDTIKNALENRH